MSPDCGGPSKFGWPPIKPEPIGGRIIPPGGAPKLKPMPVAGPMLEPRGGGCCMAVAGPAPDRMLGVDPERPPEGASREPPPQRGCESPFGCPGGASNEPPPHRGCDWSLYGAALGAPGGASNEPPMRCRSVSGLGGPGGASSEPPPHGRAGSAGRSSVRSPTVSPSGPKVEQVGKPVPWGVEPSLRVLAGDIEGGHSGEASAAGSERSGQES